MKKTLIEQLLNTCSAKKDKIAIVDNDGKRSTTYGRLMELARKVEAYLKQEAVPAHSFLCVKMPNCMEFMAAEMGIWLSHCAAVPMGMNTPDERLSTITNDCESPLLIDMQLMDEIDHLDISHLPEPLMPEITDDALLIYTSGSTGKPKGILHTFEPLRYQQAGTSSMASSPDTVFGNSAPFYFGPIVYSYDCLRAGGTVHLYTDEVKTNAQALAEYIKEHQITVSHISPGVLLHFHNISNCLKEVITVGERLTTQHSQEGYSLYNLMGATETLTLTRYRVDDKPMESVPLGHTEDYVDFCILKDDGTVASPGEEGEFCVRGSFCKCYFKDPELTAKLYEGGWLHTNDIVMMGHDGLIYYRNRKDWMVKVNGQRVEPGEVEAAILKMQGIDNVVVKGFDNGKCSQYLCAFYVANRKYSNAEFYEHLKALLPSYMQPSVFVRKDCFATNANGKVDRKALTAPERATTDKNIELPATQREKALFEMAAEVLGNNHFGVTDDLVELGMDSICATQMAMIAEKEGITIKSNDILLCRTIRALSKMKMSLLYWAKPYEEGKKTVVFCCGMIGSFLLGPRYKGIAEQYNVLVVEPYIEHYVYIVDDENVGELAALYYDLLDTMITDKSTIHGFMGFSYGGTLAYCMGQMFYEETGRACKVICGDSPLKCGPFVQPTLEEAEADIQDIINRTPGFTRLDAEIVHNSIVSGSRTMANWSATPTECEVLLFRCTPAQFEDLVSLYQGLTKKLKVVEVNDAHGHLCVAENWHDFTIRHSLDFLNED